MNGKKGTEQRTEGTEESQIVRKGGYELKLYLTNKAVIG